MMKSTLFISNIMSIDTIKQITQDILKPYKDVSCYLFGSYAKGTPSKSSDIDLLLIFDKTKRDYNLIQKISGSFQDEFARNQKYCRPIHGYLNKINEDSHILFRQYINYGTLLSGPDIGLNMNYESEEELRILEYSQYWTPMYQQKLDFLQNIIAEEKEISENTIVWQYLYLASYWHAKAKLSLVNKHHSLNKYSLEYLYRDLMQISLTEKEVRTLHLLQKIRDYYLCNKPFKSNEHSSKKHFNIVKSLLDRHKIS